MSADSVTLRHSVYFQDSTDATYYWCTPSGNLVTCCTSSTRSARVWALCWSRRWCAFSLTTERIKCATSMKIFNPSWMAMASTCKRAAYGATSSLAKKTRQKKSPTKISWCCWRCNGSQTPLRSWKPRVIPARLMGLCENQRPRLSS